ncbi:hypothetical protein [Thiorhodococcus minor]|uniref:Uncharacterized protein n=1 Tax=Thiorhodococcus minor TaxID=57489 RepID=A0A6M0JT92_9GAMM|nr:hypothetical protein [Thiorhodococcus minor]NEV60459.1 hypothetical protein [Thiorhodococcus minor]
MKLCPKCSQSRWPFVVALAVAAFVAGMTWLMLGLAAMDAWQRALIAVTVFSGVCVTLVHYVLSCLRRHCRHGHATSPSVKRALNGQARAGSG